MRVLLLLIFVVTSPYVFAQNANLPLNFVKNEGQWNNSFKYVAETKGTTAIFQQNMVSYYKSVLKYKQAQSGAILPATYHTKIDSSLELMLWNARFLGGNTSSIIPSNVKTTKYHFYKGISTSGYFENVQAYGSVKYKDVYPGIDFTYYGTENAQLKYDVTIAPNANINLINVGFEGIDSLSITTAGELKVSTKVGTYLEQKPFSYQWINGTKVLVDVKFIPKNTTGYGFQIVNNYNPAYELVIDPLTLEWATFVEGSISPTGTANCNDVKVDALKRTYLTGQTFNIDILGIANPANPGYNTYPVGLTNSLLNAYVLRINANATDVDFVTVFGSSGNDDANRIAISRGSQNPDIYVSGVTGYTIGNVAFPPNGPVSTIVEAAFVARFNSNGQLVGSLVMDGNDQDYAVGIDFTPVSPNRVYVTGATYSTTFNGQATGATSIIPPRLKAWIASLDITSTASNIVYTTIIAPNQATVAGGDGGLDLKVTDNGIVYACGFTKVENNFTTPNYSVFNPAPLFSVNNTSALAISSNCYLAVLAPNGSFNHSTIFGTFGEEFPTSLDLDNFSGTPATVYIGGVSVIHEAEFYNNIPAKFPISINSFSQGYPPVANTTQEGFICALTAAPPFQFKSSGVINSLINSNYVGIFDYSSVMVGEVDIDVDNSGLVSFTTTTADIDDSPDTDNSPISGCVWDEEHDNNTLMGIDLLFGRIQFAGVTSTVEQLTYYGEPDNNEWLPSCAIDADNSLYVTLNSRFNGISFPNVFPNPGYNVFGTQSSSTARTVLALKMTNLQATSNGGATFCEPQSCVDLSNYISISGGYNGAPTQAQQDHFHYSPNCVNVTTTTTFNVTVTLQTDNNDINTAHCIGVVPVTISIIPVPTPVISVNPTPINCGVTQATLTASAPSGAPTITSYEWNTGATTAGLFAFTSGTYTVTVIYSNGCTASASSTITLKPNPTASISPATTTICSGKSITLTASGGTSYAWSNSAATATITVSPSGTTTYTVTVTAANGCTATASRTVNVIPSPTAAISPTTANICPGANITLTASGGSSYSWSNGATTAAITVSPASTTTYTVTVTAANGCTATASRIVNVQNSISLSMTSNTQVVLNNTNIPFTLAVTNNSSSNQTVTLIYNIPLGISIVNAIGFTQNGSQLTRQVTLGINSSASYGIEVKPVLAFTGATQCNYQSQLITNTSSAQGSCGPVTASLQYTVFSHRVVGSGLAALLPSGVALETVSQAIAQGMLLNAINAANTAQTFTIEGELKVNQDYSFGNASQMIYSYAWCRPGALVTVNSTYKLSGYYLQMQECSQLWRGITVTGTGPFAPPAGELLLRNCYLQGAQYGVRLQNQCKIAISNTEFKECFIGIYYPDGEPFLPSIVQTAPFTANLFRSFGGVPAAYTTMINATNQPTPAQIPTTNRRTWAGLHLGRLSTFSCTAGNFTGLANGIVANNCNLTVTNSLFSTIASYGYNFNGVQGHGIYTTADLSLGANGNPSYAGISLYQRGVGYNSNGNCFISFGNCENGITSTGMNVDIGENCFNNCGRGVSVTGAKRGNIRINRNNIYVSNKAILLSNNDPVNIVDVGDNRISQNGGVSAIDIQEQNNPPIVKAEIHHNRVSMNSGILVGMVFNNCSGVNLPNTINYKVYNNTVELLAPASVLIGISYNNCQNLESSKNIVAGNSSTAQNSISGYPTAIHFNSSGVNFNCDSVTNIYNGIKVFGTCNNTTFKGCVMNNHTYGFYQTNGGTIPPQGSLTESYGNRWRGSYGINSARNENSLITPIFVKGTSSPYWPFIAGPVFPSLNWFRLSSGNPTLCGNDIGAGFKTDEEETKLNGLDALILADSLEFTDFEDPLKWQNEKALYEKLKQNPELKAENEIAESFYNMLDTATIGSLSAVEETKKQAQQPTPAVSHYLNEFLLAKETLLAQIAAVDTLTDTLHSPATVALRQQELSILQPLFDSVSRELAQLQDNISQETVNQLPDLNYANTLVNAAQPVETNLKQFNQVYLATVAAGLYSFNSTQLGTLKYIAFQCPLAGGEAVYKARGLLSLVMDTFYNDKEICLAAGIAYKKEKEEKVKNVDENLPLQLKAYPNPVNTYITIASNVAITEQLRIQIHNSWGGLVKEQNLNLSTQSYRLNVSDLSTGLYFLRVFNNKESVFSKPINILH